MSYQGVAQAMWGANTSKEMPLEDIPRRQVPTKDTWFVG
jgi:hypothetical protein